MFCYIYIVLVFIWYCLSVVVLLICHFCVRATDQRRYRPRVIALEILNEVLNVISGGAETLAEQR